MTILDVAVADIFQQEADAMMMFVDINGKWIGRFLGAYEIIAFEHSGPLMRSAPLPDGAVVMVRNPGAIAPGLERIIFVVAADEGEISLAELIKRGLRFADERFMQRVTLPVIRAIGQPGLYSYNDLVAETIKSAQSFAEEECRNLHEIMIVLNENPDWPPDLV